jgi:hypothetical protein
LGEIAERIGVDAGGVLTDRFDDAEASAWIVRLSWA